MWRTRLNGPTALLMLAPAASHLFTQHMTFKKSCTSRHLNCSEKWTLSILCLYFLLLAYEQGMRDAMSSQSAAGDPKTGSLTFRSRLLINKEVEKHSLRTVWRLHSCASSHVRYNHRNETVIKGSRREI